MLNVTYGYLRLPPATSGFLRLSPTPDQADDDGFWFRKLYVCGMKRYGLKILGKVILRDIISSSQDGIPKKIFSLLNKVQFVDKLSRSSTLEK